MKYKIGDIVRVISRDAYEQDKSLMSPTHSLACGKVFTIKNIVKCSLDNKERYIFDNEDVWTKGTYWTDEMIEGLVEEENKDMDKELRKCKSDFKYWVDNYIILPDGYIFKDENGNVINATKIVLEKKKNEYPKKYKKCCDVLGLNTMANDAQGYKAMLIIRFQELLIARDAYWKIAGEEMGLRKPWEPDWTYNGATKYCIGVSENEIQNFSSGIAQYILAFPTEEMRDAFYENFKELIEICKELL